MRACSMHKQVIVMRQVKQKPRRSMCSQSCHRTFEKDQQYVCLCLSIKDLVILENKLYTEDSRVLFRAERAVCVPGLLVSRPGSTHALRHIRTSEDKYEPEEVR